MNRRSILQGVTMAGFAAAVPTFVSSASAQEAKPKSMRIQAIAQGTSTQLGTIVNVDIIIREFSTEEDRQALIAAFQAKGSQGLSRALGKMSSRGRIALTGTLGYDINFIRLIESPTGRMIRFVTDRPIRFGEAWHDTRSSDYDLSAGEINLSGEKDKGTGTLMPACQFTLDKDKGLEIELRKNAWKLVNVSVHE